MSETSLDMTLGRIEIVTGSKAEAFALKSWLDDVRELRGRTSVVVLSPEPGSQGGVTDVLTVALGSGGAAALLMNAIVKWMAIRGRARPLKVKVKNGSRSVEIEVDQTKNSADILKTVLDVIQDGDVEG